MTLLHFTQHSSHSPRKRMSLPAAAFAAFVIVTLGGPIQAADQSSAWAASLKNLTPAEGLTLLKLARDFFQHEELSDSNYTRCIDPYDTAAADRQAKEEIYDALDMVEGATRRMGYKTYPGITDEYERLRLSKMLAEGRWMRKFKKAVEQCLYDQAEVKAKLKLN